MKRTWYRFLALVLCLAMILPTGTAFAAPQNHTVSDVTVAEGTGTNDYRWPAVVNAGDKLLAVFVNNSDKAVYLSESTNNGQSWSTPEVVLASSVGAGSPDLSYVDGTVFLTYNASSKAWMMTSADGGENWSEAVSLRSDLLTVSQSASSAVTEMENGDILIALYGKDNNPPKSGWYAETVAVRYTNNNGTWEYVSEEFIAEYTAETALAQVGNDVVYAFCGESGKVFMADYSVADPQWTEVAQEQPRATSSGGMTPEMIEHPAFVKVDDNRWFVTFTNVNAGTEAWETAGKIVYGKMFYPAAGWDATISRPLYSGDGVAAAKGSPVVTLTNDNKLLTVYYDSTKQSVFGTFSELTDWPSPAEETGLDIVKFDFESTTLPQYLAKAGGASIEDGVIDLKPSATGAHNIDVESGRFMNGSFVMQYDFMFDANNTSGEMWIMPRNTHNSHKITLSTTELAIKTGNQGNTDADVLVTEKEDFSLNKGEWYTVKMEKTGSTLRVKVWARGSAEPAEWDVSATDSSIGENSSSLRPWYIRNYFYGWAAGQHMYVDNMHVYKPAILELNKTYITAEAGDESDALQLAARFWPNEALAEELPAKELTFTSSNPDVVTATPVSGTNRAKLNLLKAGKATVTVSYGNLSAQCVVNVTAAPEPKWDIVNEDFSDTTLAQYLEKAGGASITGGVIKLSPSATGAHNIDVYDSASSGGRFLTGSFVMQYDLMFDANNTGGEMWIMPRNTHNSHKIIVSAAELSIKTGSQGNKDTDVLIAEKEDFSLSYGQWYTVKMEKTGSTLRAKVWTKGDAEPGEWDVSATDASIGENSSSLRPWYIRNYFYGWATGQHMYVDNMNVYKQTTMTLDETELNAEVGQEDVQLTAVFNPDVAAQKPVPAVTFESSDGSVVKAEQNADEPWKADLTFLKAGSATITAKLGDYKAQCTVTVESTESATRWEFYAYDFEDWSKRPAGLTNNIHGPVAVENGVAHFEPAASVSEVRLWRSDGNYITGKHSFQFDFKFDEDDTGKEYAAKNAVWFRPYYSDLSSVKVNVTQDSVALYYEAAYGCEYGFEEGKDTVIQAPVAHAGGRLAANKWYTVRCEKDGLYFRVKVWERDAGEPEAWLVNVMHNSSTSRDLETKVGFYVKHRGTGMDMDNLKIFKDTVMTFAKEEIHGGLDNPSGQLAVQFTPDITAELPVPAVTFTSSDDSIVTAVQNAEEPWKADLTFLKKGSAVITAKMDDYRATCTVTVVDTVAEEATDIGSRLELFLDEELIAELTGSAQLLMHEPVKAPDSENPFPRGHYTTVIWDEEEGVYRGYYRADGFWGQRTCYVESTDGINWVKPVLDVWPDDASGLPNVIICPPDIDSENLQKFEHNFSPFLDTREGVPASERYKAVAGYYSDGEYTSGDVFGLYTLVSPDGIHWTRQSDEPVLKFNNTLHSWAFDSQNVAFWSEAEQLYVCYYRHYKYSSTETSTRTVGRATSPDFVTWTDEAATFVTPNLSADEQLYTSQTAPYFRAPHIYISAAARYALGNLGGKPATGNVGAIDTMLMSSRAGSDHFDRIFAEAFLRPGLDMASWTDRWNYTSLNFVPTAYGEMSFYRYSGDRYTLRTDGFVSVNAGAEGGEIITKPIIFSGEDLLLNFSASVKGSVVVELQDDYGNPYKGFEASKCVPLTGDWIERAVTWKSADVSELIGKPVKIRFILTDADLYSYKFGTADQPVSIEATFNQTETVYALSRFEKLVPMLTVEAVYANGNRVEIPYGAYSIRGPLAVNSGNVPATKTVTIYYGDLTDSIDVLCSPVLAESVSAEFTKGQITSGMTLNELAETMTVTVTNNDGSTAPVYPGAYTLSCSRVVPGATVTVTYKDLTATVKIPSSIETVEPTEKFFPNVDSTYVESTGEYENISDRLELFVDDNLVESTDGVNFKLHTPVKAADSENPFPRAYYTTVIWDEEFGVYRGYYRAEGFWGARYCYIESTDGINWYKPVLNVFPDDPSGLPNVVIAPNSIDPQNVQQFEHNFSPFLDTNPNCDPNERFKAIAGYCGDLGQLPAGEQVGLYTLVSPDGIHWTRQSDEPIIAFSNSKHSWAFDSQNVGFWSEAEGQYVLYYRHYKYSASETSTRTVGRATSTDFITWTDEVGSFQTPNFSAEEQLYAAQVTPYFRAPHIYISNTTRYALGNLVGYDPVTATNQNLGATDTMLMTSRAGSDHFDRLFDEAFLRPGLDVANWTDRFNYVSLNFVPTGADEISFYHYNGDRYTLRTDGFVSANAGAEGGSLTTKPVIFSGDKLILNYSASVKGSVKAELLDVNGNVISGFSAANCNELVGDRIEQEITWKNANVSSLKGQAVKIRFILKDCDLYSYRFAKASEPVVTGITADFQQGDNLVFALGRFEQLEPMLTVTANLSDGTSVVLGPDAYSLRGALAAGSGNVPATQTITVYYGDFTDTFQVLCSPVSVDSLDVAVEGTISPDTPLEDVKDQLTVTANNNDGSQSPVDDDVYTLTESGSGENRVITVSYKGKTFTIGEAAEPEEPGIPVVPVYPVIPENPDPVDPVVPTVEFSDVASTAWYHEAVEYVVAKGLMSGMSDTEFGPSYTLNRAMVVTVLWRLEGEPVANYAMSFTDVPAGQWYTEAIRWAASQGIVNGIDAKTYAPLNAVTREQLVTILYRYAQKKGYDVSVGEDTNILSYVDAFDIAEYAIPAMQWACGAGVINGNDDGSLNPKGNTKRSEFAKVIMNFCENVAE